MKLSAVLALLGALLLSACSSQRQDASRPQAWLKPGTRVTLPAPGIAPAIVQQQLLSATVKGKTQSMLVLLSADEQKLVLAGLSPLGIRLFRVTYDALGVKTEQTVKLPEMPPASQVLADIMLSYWPLEAWRPQLPRGWSLTDNHLRRELRDEQGELIESITYAIRDGKRQPVAIQHYRFGYSIAIQQLGVAS